MARLKLSKKGISFIIISLIVLVVLVLLGKLILSKTTTETPIVLTKQFMSQYQKATDKVMKDVKYPYDDELTDVQLAKFKELVKSQYLSLDYEIVDKNIGEIDAIIKVEFEVLDYASSYEKANSYLSLYEKDMSEEKKNDYRLKQMQNTQEKIKYGLEFSFYKLDGEWKMLEVTKSDLSKLAGTY